MSYTGTENHSISLQDAAGLTSNFRSSHLNAITGFYYSKQAISAILNQVDCVGIRIYFGEDNNGIPKLVICGVESNEDDLYTGLLAEFGSPCPPYHSLNALNS